MPTHKTSNYKMPTMFGQKKTLNYETPNQRKVRNLCKTQNNIRTTRTMLASRPGVARCSLRSQTFACLSLQYCLSLHVVLTLFWHFVIWHFVIWRFFSFLFSKHNVEIGGILALFLAYRLSTLRKICFSVFFGLSFFGVSHRSGLRHFDNVKKLILQHFSTPLRY